MNTAYLTSISVYETAQHYYVTGQEEQNSNAYRLFKIERNSPNVEFSATEDGHVYSLAELNAVVDNLYHGNSSSFRKICGPYPALLGLFRWSAGFYLVFVTKTKTLGQLHGVDIYGIEGTTLITLSSSPSPSSSVTTPTSTSPDEARAKRLLLLVLDVKSDFFFSFSWPVWSTVQSVYQHYSNNDNDNVSISPWTNVRVWNQHLSAPLRLALQKCGGSSAGSESTDTCQWTVPLVMGYFEQRKLSLLGAKTVPLTLTLIARRSCRFAGTRYRKRGISEEGAVANDVEIEQILEIVGSGGGVENTTNNKTPTTNASSVVQVRGSVPLFWAQQQSSPWDAAVVRPTIRMLHHLDPLYTATCRHFNDLHQRYGAPIQCLDLLRHGDSRQQETVLSREYSNAIAFLNRNTTPMMSTFAHGQNHTPTATKQQGIGYVHWDLRRHAKSQGSHVMADLQSLQAPLLARTGIFCVVVAAHQHQEQEQEQEQILQQHGIVRTNCVDCLDRTNVAQFTYGLLALGAQLHALGLSPHPTVDPRSSLATELMGLYEAMGHALAQQYGGSEAHSGFFEKWRGTWQTALQGRHLLTSIRRFYSNAITDEDKQAAINMFLGAFAPPPLLPVAASTSTRSSSMFNQRYIVGASGGGGSGGLNSITETIDTYGNGTVATPPTLREVKEDKVEGEDEVAVAVAVEGDSPVTNLLQSSTSTESLASELDAGTDISLNEVLHSAVAASMQHGSQSPRVIKARPSQPQPHSKQQQQQQHKVVLESMADILPTGVRQVRLYGNGPTTTTSTATNSSSTAAVASGGAVPSGPSAAWLSPKRKKPLPPSSSAGTTAKASIGGEKSQWMVLGGSPTSPSLQRKSSEVLPSGIGSYHTLSGLNLEGAPDLPPPPLGGNSTMDVSHRRRPPRAHSPPPPPPPPPPAHSAGLSSMVSDTTRRLSFASLNALRNLIGGGGGGTSGGTGGGGVHHRFLSSSSFAADASMSRSASALALEPPKTASVWPINTNTTATNTHSTTDVSWLLSQRAAVSHGLDDLGLPAQVAPLWSVPTPRSEEEEQEGEEGDRQRPTLALGGHSRVNVVGVFARERERNKEQHDAMMHVMATPLGPSERREAQRQVMAHVRPTVVVNLPSVKT